MKKLALLLLALPLAACAAEPTAVSQNCSRFTGMDYDNCVEAFTPHYAQVSHWQMTASIYRASSTPSPPSPNRGPVYSSAGFGSGDWSRGTAH